MEWLDEAIVLSARPHGENAAIVTLLTSEQGRYAGLLPGGQGRTAQPILQPGNAVKAKWRARLADQLGHYSLELVSSNAAPWLDNVEVLSIIASAAVVTEASLPERQGMPGVYAGLSALLSLSLPDVWGPSYVKWEIGLLNALGYGLDLSRCAMTGTTDNLAYVSPRTGRAASLEAGYPYRDKLLPLPGFLTGQPLEGPLDIVKGLDITAYFLRTHIFANPHSRLLNPSVGDLPLARQRLGDYYRKKSEKSADEVA